MPIVVIEGPTIAAGQSLSNAVDLTQGTPVRLTMPAEWTSALMSFQISTDGQFFNDLFAIVDQTAREIVIAPGPGGSGIRLPAILAGNVHYKIRSGTSQHPVPQPTERVFAIAIETSV